MEDATALIPAPPVVRAKLARNIREGELLRALLKLAIRAAEERHRIAEAPRPEGHLSASA